MNILGAYSSGPNEARAVIEYLVAKLESFGVPFIETVGPFVPQPVQQSYPIHPVAAYHYVPQNEPAFENAEEKPPRSGWGQRQKSLKANQKNRIVKRVNFKEPRRSEEPVREEAQVEPNSPSSVEDNTMPCPKPFIKTEKHVSRKVDWNAL